jgi:hypothetical protein
VPATIYFSGSITGGRGDLALYREIVDALSSALEYPPPQSSTCWNPSAA